MRRNYATSTCCGAECTMPEVGICPDCLEHCEWEDIEEELEAENFQDEPSDEQTFNAGNMEGGISYTNQTFNGR